jgi:hypothetical protein
LGDKVLIFRFRLSTPPLGDFQLLISSSTRLDPAHNIDILPPSPHQQMGKLLVGPLRHLSLDNSLGSHRAVATRQWLSLDVTVIYRYLASCTRSSHLSSSHNKFDDSPEQRVDAAAPPSASSSVSPPIFSL